MSVSSQKSEQVGHLAVGTNTRCFDVMDSVPVNHLPAETESDFFL